MAWLANLVGGSCAKIAAIAAAVGAALLFLAKVFRAGGDAERAKSAKAALDHVQKTGEQVTKSDDAVADPRSERAKYVRQKFERED